MKSSNTQGKIMIRFYGRLGNQLFQYSFARALQEKFYPDYKIVLNFCEYSNGLESNYLQGFNIQNCDIVNIPFRNCLNKSQFFVQCIWHVLARYCQKFSIIPSAKFDTRFTRHLMNPLGVYEPLCHSDYIEPLLSRSKNILCAGFFESHKYFDDIRDSLLKEFTPTNDKILPHNEQLFYDITNSESVCVSIRRGDFLGSNIYDVCNEEYFITAMKSIREKIPVCKFFIFSDDVQDVKKIFHFPFSVEYEEGGDPVWEKLRLMYNCRHFIISNSTFSWWAQYLSKNPNKIVYAPKPWRRSDDCLGIYTPQMNIIRVS